MPRIGSVDGQQKFAVEKLDAFWAAVDLLRLYDRTGPTLWRRNAGLCRQLQRAIASVISNLGEAGSCLSKGDRRRYFEYAYRSAGECSAQIIGFHAIGAFTPEEYQQARLLVHRIQAMLLRLIQRSSSPKPRRNPPPSKVPAPPHPSDHAPP